MAFAFCELCSRSVEAGKGHVFTRAHQGSVKRYLGKATVEMGEVVPFLSPVIDLWRGSATAPHSAITTSFWCRFCNEEVVDSGRFACRAAVEHLFSSAHRDHVLHFMTRNIPDKSQRIPDPFCVSGKVYQEYHAAISVVERAPPPAPPPPPPISTSPPPTSPPSAPAASPPTRVSGLGILQNPTGSHDGKRVWGGGIIKLGRDWVPWEVDALCAVPPTTVARRTLVGTGGPRASLPAPTPAPEATNARVPLEDVPSVPLPAPALLTALPRPPSLPAGQQGPSGLFVSQTRVEPPRPLMSPRAAPPPTIARVVALVSSGQEVSLEAHDAALERQRALLRRKLTAKQAQLAKHPG